MNAINHAATALLVNKKWPGVPTIPVLLSVQLVELFWVAFNLLGVETIYGVWCWWVFRGSKALLAIIVGLNLAALSFYAPAIHGPEHLLAGHPKIFAAAIGVHIIVGLVTVGYFARTQWRSPL